MSENVSENVREPQVLDTIGKGGNYWRITEIDEEGNVVAWRLYDGTIYKKGRPLKITVDKILDGTFRLIDIPPVKIVKQEPINPDWGKEIQPPEKDCEEPEPPAALLMEDYQGMKMRLEDRIEFLDTLQRKAQEETEKLQRELDNVTRDRDMLKAQLANAVHDRDKAEGKVDGLMTALKMLAEARS